MIRVQEADFHVQEEYEQLQKSSITGAAVIFVGTVRDFGGEQTDAFYLQHYPGMTERVLEKIEAEANQRWRLINTTIIHRVGHLNVDDQIVFVGASSAHREDAFFACQYMIDVLKTQAPFWKKEGDQWVEANETDNQKADRWIQPPSSHQT